MIICEICKQECEVIVSAYRKQTFNDGNCYNTICFKCASVPKNFEEDENGEWNEAYCKIHTLEELQEFGWSKDEIIKSYKAVKKLLDKSGYPDINDTYILDRLFISASKTPIAT